MIRLDDQPPMADQRSPRLVAEAPNMPTLARRSRRGETERERRSFELSVVLGLENAQPLSLLRCGDIGCILAVRDPDHHLSGSDIERGLLEMGFVEGACIEVLHQGFPSRDPLAVRINQSMTVALRRSEASAVLVGPLLAQSDRPSPMPRSGSAHS